MSLFKEKDEMSTAKKTPAKAVKSASKTAGKAAGAAHSDIAYRTLSEPWITEKTHALMSIGKYTFKVMKKATKMQVKKAVEGMYGVSVEDVTIVNVKSRKKAYGRHVGVRSGFKKATVTVKEGQSIEFFKQA